MLHVLETLAAGGVETTFLAVMKRFPRQRVEHHVLAFAGGALEAEYRAAAHTVTIESRQRTLRVLLSTRPFDVVHILFERCAARLLPDLLTLTSSRVVYGKNYDFSGQWRSTEGFEWAADDALISACDAVTFTTSQLSAVFRGAASRATVLGKAADVAPLLDVPLPSDDTPNEILVIANPTPRKRLGDMVEALARVRARVPDATVRVIGRGDPVEVDALLGRAGVLGVAGRFTLAGPTRDVRSALTGCRVVALSSGSEGVPTALLEGMAAGRPVVTTAAGHVRSVVRDGVNGFVVPVGDVASLADRLAQLLESPALAEEMGVRGRGLAQRHAVEAISRRLFDVLTGRAA